MYSPLNSYAYIHWILDFKYILLLYKTIYGLSNRASPTTHNNSITFNNKIANTPKHIANCFTKQFTNTVKHAFSHQNYLTFTPQTYHHRVHRFRSWPTQMTSPSHPHTRVQPRNIYNHTYRNFLSGQDKTIAY